MKIFVHVTASAINDFLDDHKLFDPEFSYSDCILNILKYGSTSMLGFNPYDFPDKYFVSFSNSEYLQKKWATEQGLTINKNWEIEVLQSQIENFQPNVLYTVNPKVIVNIYDQLPRVDLYAFWRAAPVDNSIDYSKFKVGLTYANRYKKLLLDAGVDNVDIHSFSFDPEIVNRLNAVENKTDLVFIGTYNSQFNRRNKLLTEIAKNFLGLKSIRFYLRTSRKWKGLFPDLPFIILPAYRKPVYLRQMLIEYLKSRIVFNCHSDLSKDAKGNMRVFEALGTKSFLLTDKGDYPTNLVPGEDFITYDSPKDLKQKVIHYLSKPDLREQIGLNGYKKVKQHYNVEIGYQRLISIFSKYL